jgi:hypothetical protein
MKIRAVILLSFFIFEYFQVHATAADITPVKFESMSFASDLKIHFVDMSFMADEKWHVSGECATATSKTKVHVVSMSFMADKKIHLVDMAFMADREICITNPKDAPEEFWKAYRR